MSDARDARSRSVDPFNAPEDYADPWRGRGLTILLVWLVLAVLVVALFVFLT